MSVRVRALRKAFRAHEVLKGIDLDIAPGEVVGLIGPNGAGKTTLMSCLLGFLRPNAGEITIDGKANDDLDVRRRTGFVPERMNFDRGATGWNFLRYMARLAEVRDADAKSRAMLERLGLSGAADRRLSQYSRGMLQRIGMCQALIHEPDYLFLDEPTSGLDPNGVLLVRDLIIEQKARGAAVLLNSHQLAEIEKVCDRVLFLHKGIVERAETLRHTDRIVVAITMLPGFDAEALRLIPNAQVQENVLLATVEREEDIARLVRELVGAGAGVIDVRRHTTDLESIFRGAA
jgi:ABC-2 type transport system ATP-binding protein